MFCKTPPLVPGSLSDIEGDGISDTLGLFAQYSETGDNVVGRIRNGVVDFNVVVQLKVEFQTELDQQAQEAQVFPSQTMMADPHENDAFSCGKPPGMTNSFHISYLGAQGGDILL